MMIRSIGGKHLPDPRNMKEPDSPDDLEQTISETFDEMHAEAQIAPIVLALPPEVIESVEAYTKEHSLEPATLIPLAIKALEHQVDEFGEAGERLMEDPDSFAWPLEDPLLCVALAFMLKHAYRCAHNLHEKHDLSDDEDEPADWCLGYDCLRRAKVELFGRRS
jgi:hypothetical protein